MNLKPYPEYKDSGVPWLGKIPRHWEMRKTKYLFKERVQKGFPNEPLLAATQTKGVVPKTHYENRTVIAQKDLHLLKLVKKGDFVISLRSFQGGIELAHYQGIISPAYTIMNPNNEVSDGYFKHLAKSKLFIKLLTTCVTGIREGQNIDYEILKRTRLPIPTNEEQTDIARFLDYKTAQIARFIKAKKRMIELLKEQKQVIINDAVTGKIDVTTGKPYPKYKDSGVKWLGRVPEGWEVRRIKHLSKILRGKFSHRPRNDSRLYDGEYPFIQTGDVARAGKYITNYKQTLNKSGFGVSAEFPKGTLVMTIAANIGDVAILEFDACFPDSIVGFLPNDYTDQNYLYLVFLSMKNELLKQAPVNTQGNLNIERIGSMFIPLPDIESQKEIISYIETKTAALALTISRTEREIALMQEYRTRLISDVVTGRIDVRDIEIPDIDDTINELTGETEGEEELETAEVEE